jgi:hypothetical protein
MQGWQVVNFKLDCEFLGGTAIAIFYIAKVLSIFQTIVARIDFLISTADATKQTLLSSQ